MKEFLSPLLIFIAAVVFFMLGLIVQLFTNPMYINTYHHFTVDMDDETAEALKYLADIKEHEVRENNLFCENQLLNQSKMYDIMLQEQKYYYEVVLK